MFTQLLNQTATVERRTATGFDVYGNETTTFAGSGDSQVNLPCWIHEQPGTEDNDGRETVVRRATGFLEADADILAYDRLSVDGTTWEVRGNPRVLRTGRGDHHIEVDLEEVIV